MVLAATGTVSATNKYAWGDKSGWINFGGLTITDSAITGYAWNENYGWINFSAGTGVANTTAGALSGYAWGQNTGWINFSGVSINCSGKFAGTATGNTVIGTITFDCSNCNVTTSWLPSSGCEGGGGGIVYNYSHTECSSEEKCVSVSGVGADTCQKNDDCANEACDPHGDINKDGSINLSDFSILMYYWHDTPPANKCADINKDGTVDLADFSIMLYWWTG